MGISGAKHKESIAVMSLVWCYSAFILLNHFSPDKPLHHFKEEVAFVHICFYFQKDSEYLSTEMSEIKKVPLVREHSLPFKCWITAEKLRNEVGVFIRELPACPVTSSPAWGIQGYLHIVKTLILQHISDPNGRLTCLPQYTTYLLLPSLHYSRCLCFWCFCPQPSPYHVCWEQRECSQYHRLELSTFWH